MAESSAIGVEKLNFVKDKIREARDIVEQLYIPDLLAVASFYPEWTGIGGGLGSYLVYGDLPRTTINDPASFLFPRGVILDKNLAEVLPVDPEDLNEITESVTHSWYRYPAGVEALHPYEGVTEPHYTGPKPPFEELDEDGTYSWLKAPRWKGRAVEVGPLARMLVGYASGREDFKEVVEAALTKLGVPATALFSTLGRTAARGLETQLGVVWLMEEHERLIANIKAGNTATADTRLWTPDTWPADCRGYGLSEAPRGALGHWIHIKDGRIENYQAIVPSTWNASPKDSKGQPGAYEAALVGTPMVDPEQPLEILRTIHSFDPCLACASHVFGPDGRELASIRIR
jgi:hydrogenase large subunit